MNRWTQYDEDEYRLPEGMVRVGYDADTQRYTFQRGNELWLGEPGVHYGGQMTRIGVVDDDSLEQGRDIGDTSHRSDGYQTLDASKDVVVSNRYTNRVFYYFVLVISLFLVVVWKYVISARSAAHNHHKHKSHCPDGVLAPMYHVKPGDTCWEIAHSLGFELGAILNQTLNPKLDCDHLYPNDVVCLPLNGSPY